MKLIVRKKPSRVLAAACLVVALGAASCSAAPSRLAQNADNANAIKLQIGDAKNAKPLAIYDFREASQVAQIEGVHALTTARATADGALISISGNDPYVMLPAVDLPSGVPLWAHLRIKATQSGGVSLYFWNAAQLGPSEERTASAFVSGDGWQDVLIPLPAMGPGTHFRIDPPGGQGSDPVTIASLLFTPRANIAAPQWPAIAKLKIAPNTPLQLRSGALTLRHDGKSSGGFTVSIGGKLFARGLTPSLIGYETPRGAQWLNLKNASTRVTREKRGSGFAIIETTTARDAGGATWILTREYSPSKRLGGFEVTARVRVSRNRRVVFCRF